MTDNAYHAKEWLEHLGDLYDKARKTERVTEDLRDRINSAVSSYENIGSGRADLIVRQQQREDRLLDYSVKRAQFEREYLQFVRQEFIVMNVLERMRDRRKALILFDRYINRIGWNDMLKLKRYELKRSSLLRLHRQALEELAELLTTEEPRAISETEAVIREYIAKVSA